MLESTSSEVPWETKPKPCRVGFAFRQGNGNAPCLAQSYNAQGDNPVAWLKMEVPIRWICMGVGILTIKICLAITLAWGSPLGTPKKLPTIPQL